MNTFKPHEFGKIVNSINVQGYAVIEDMLSEAERNVVMSEAQPHLDDIKIDPTNKFMGTRTKRFGRLLHRMPSARTMATNCEIKNVLDAVLLNYASTYQIHFTGVMHVMAGQKEQSLHRDLTPFANPSPIVVLASMWAITDFTEENGATVIVPGSHLWHEDREAKPKEKVKAVMEAGSVLLYAGNLIHGAGSGHAAEARTGVNIQYSAGWMRQEENQYLAVPLEQAKTFPEDLQRLMGYEQAAQHWGYVDQQHPMNFLNETDKYGEISAPHLSYDNMLYCTATPQVPGPDNN